MSSSLKRIAEWVVIGLFIAIVSSFVSVQIYRSAVNSDWYTEKQARRSLEQTVEKVKDIGNIKYIEVDDTVEQRYIYDVPAELFDDIEIISYERARDIEKLLEIWRTRPCVTVFFNDKTATSFYITEEGNVFWGELFELECPSFVSWYSEVINENE